MASFSTASYAMGRTEYSVPITAASAQQSKRALGKMRGSLKAWLRFRTLNDTSPSTPQLARVRAANEQVLADQLHELMAEVFDGQSLPSPDLSKNPQGAVELAQLAIAGKLPGEQGAPTAQGFVWLWPTVFIVGAIAYVIATQITSSADVAKETERYQCIQSGKCTDYGFWLKLAGIVTVGWIVWDKFGAREALTGKRKARMA